MNVNIVATGKLKESYLRQACGEYAKRLGAFCRFDIKELPEARLPQSPSQKEIESALKKEADQIISYLQKGNSYNIAMCIEGRQMTSEEFSSLFERAASSGKSTVNFIIGSSFGLADDLKEQCDFKMSMSKMTFPHQLARVILSEQIYRAFSIANSGKYHK